MGCDLKTGHTTPISKCKRRQNETKLNKKQEQKQRQLSET